MRSALRATDRLDPRSRIDALCDPRPASVSIPVDALRARVSELPPPGAAVRVADAGPAGIAALAALRSLGREAVIDASATPAAATPSKHRLWRPSPWLETLADQIEAVNALDMACGVGRDAVFLASCGVQVTAVDILPDALARGAELERLYADDAPPIRWVRGDLRRADVPVGGPFALVVCVRHHDADLLRRAKEWVRPGGSLVIEAFTPTHRERTGRPASAAETASGAELESLLAGMEIRAAREHDRGDAHTACIWAVRTGWSASASKMPRQESHP